MSDTTLHPSSKRLLWELGIILFLVISTTAGVVGVVHLLLQGICEHCTHCGEIH